MHWVRLGWRDVQFLHLLVIRGLAWAVLPAFAPGFARGRSDGPREAMRADAPSTHRLPVKLANWHFVSVITSLQRSRTHMH
jgi:hypothetical protein